MKLAPITAAFRRPAAAWMMARLAARLELDNRTAEHQLDSDVVVIRPRMKWDPFFRRGARKVVLGKVRPIVRCVCIAIDQGDLALESEAP